MSSPQKENGYTPIANEIMEALAKTRIAGEARQVLDFILRKTYGFKKKEDTISLSQFYLGTGLKNTHTCRAIKYLLNINLIIKNDNGKITKYRFNKDFETWKPLSKKIIIIKNDNLGSPKNDNLPVPKMVHTIVDTTKDTITKDIEPTPKNKPLTPPQEFVKGFSLTYQSFCGYPFKADSKHFIIAARLVKDYGLPAIIEKTKILVQLCADKSVWFTKDGWADFTIEKLSSMWNSIIPKLSKEEEERAKFEKIRKEDKEHNERVKNIIKSGRN